MRSPLSGPPPRAAAAVIIAAVCFMTAGIAVAADGVPKSVTDALARWSKPITKWPGPNTSVAAPSGKKLTVLTCGSTGITCVRVANGVKAAGAALGYSVNVIDGQNQPSVWNSALQTAIASKTDGIVLAAVPPSLVQGAAKAARKAGIPIVAVLSVQGASLVSATVNYDRKITGTMLADFVTANSKGKASIIELRDKEFPETEDNYTAFEAQLKKVCAGCTVVQRAQFSLALSPQRIPGVVSTALQKNPKATYIIQPFDAITPFTTQGINAAKNTTVRIVGVSADPPSISALKSGVEVASDGTPAEWMGWQATDDLVRIFAGKKVEHPAVPQRLITKANVPGASGYQGDYNYQAKYKKLWGR